MIVAQDFEWACRLAAGYDVGAGLTYFTVDHFECKLDVYRLRDSEAARPTVMFMHGGGWLEGSTKETWSLWFLPFLQLGWTVVNVDYRHSGVALAPAAVEDCQRALHWMGRNAKSYCIDLQRLVIAGLSAGGHLALTTGMMSAPEWIEEGAEWPKPAAIVNWCGITDVADLVAGRHRQEFAGQWVGERADKLAIARAVSPLTYVRSGLPPIITVHGDRDEAVPYSQAVRLHEALSAAGVVHELITLPGAGHSALEAYMSAYPRIFDFLSRVASEY